MPDSNHKRTALANYKPTTRDRAELVLASGVTVTEAVDLSQGTSAVVAYHFITRGVTSSTLDFVIQFSADKGFTTPVDNVSTDNAVVDESGVPISANLVLGTGDLYMKIANPPGGIRYARLKITESGGDAGDIQSTQFVGPQHYVSAD